MNDLSKFATEHHPLHCSTLPAIMRCDWSEVMKFVSDYYNESGRAAQTGTATHVAVSKWHKGAALDEALEIMQEMIGEYPLADLRLAERYFRRYADDPRNEKKNVEFSEICVERRACAGKEKEKEIVIVGTCDQLRRVEGILYVYDLKTGLSGDGFGQLNTYLYQIVAYSWCATEVVNELVLPGGLITTSGYKGPEESPSGVFWRYNLSFDDVNRLMDRVILRVLDIRKGRITIQPGHHCAWCPMTNVNTCVSMYNQLL